MKETNVEALTLFCSNCSEKLIAHKNGERVYTCVCPVCGVKAQIKPLSRRCIVTEFRAPKGQTLI